MAFSQSILRAWKNHRIFRHAVLSLLGWGLMYMVFYLEVSQLDWRSQHAKLSITPIGFPLGLAIQWLVFRDRLGAILRKMNLKQAVLRHGWRWLAVKCVSFVANQVGYAFALHRMGLPYWAAYPAAAAILSLVFYTANLYLVFRLPPRVQEIETV